MIQDIAPYKFSNAYSKKRPGKTSFALYFKGHTTLTRENAREIQFPRFEELHGNQEELTREATYLFAINEDRFYLVNQIPEE